MKPWPLATGLLSLASIAAALRAQDQPAAPKPVGPTPAVVPDPAAPTPTTTTSTTRPPATEAPTVTPLAHVEVRGTGPVPIILVPALVCEWSIYNSFMSRNAERFTMYAVTLPGFGKSEPPPAPPEPESFAQTPWLDNAELALLALVNDRKLDKPILLGVSTGGHIALRAALRAPGSFRALITLNGLPAIPLHGTTVLPKASRARIVNEEYAGYWRQKSDAEWTLQQELWIKESFPDPERAKAVLASAAPVPKSTSGRYMLEYFVSDLSTPLSKLDLPILAISSLPVATDPRSKDLRDDWVATYGKLRQAKLAFFYGSGEFVTEDSPEELDRAIRQFLADEPVEGKVPKLPPPPSKPAETPKPPAAKPPEPK